VFHRLMKHVSSARYYFLKKMILEGEIKDAKMSSFSSDFQTQTLNINFLCVFFMNYCIVFFFVILYVKKKITKKNYNYNELLRSLRS